MPRALRSRVLDTSKGVVQSSSSSLASTSSSATSRTSRKTTAKPKNTVTKKPTKASTKMTKASTKKTKASTKSVKKSVRLKGKTEEGGGQELKSETEMSNDSEKKSDDLTHVRVGPNRKSKKVSVKSPPVTNSTATTATSITAEAPTASSKRPIYLSSSSTQASVPSTAPSTQEEREQLYELNRENFGPDPPKRRRTTKKANGETRKRTRAKPKKARAVLAFGEEELEVVKEAIRGIDNITFSSESKPKLKERETNVMANESSKATVKKKPLILTTRPGPYLHSMHESNRSNYGRHPSVVYRSSNRENKEDGMAGTNGSRLTLTNEYQEDVEAMSASSQPTEQCDSMVSITDRCDHMHLAPPSINDENSNNQQRRARSPSPVYLNFSKPGTPGVVNFDAITKDKISTPRVDQIDETNRHARAGKKAVKGKKRLLLKKQSLKELIDNNFGFNTDDEEEEPIHASKTTSSNVVGPEMSPVRKIGNGHRLFANNNDNTMNASIFSPLPLKPDKKANSGENLKHKEGPVEKECMESEKMMPPKPKAGVTSTNSKTNEDTGRSSKSTKSTKAGTKQTLIYEVVRGLHSTEHKQLKGANKQRKTKNDKRKKDATEDTMTESHLFSDDDHEDDDIRLEETSHGGTKKRRLNTFERKRHSSNKQEHGHSNNNNDSKRTGTRMDDDQNATNTSQAEKVDRSMVDSQLSHFDEVAEFELTFV